MSLPDQVVLYYSVTDREVDPWVFSRKGKLGGSDVPIGGVGALRPQCFRNYKKVGRKSTMLQEKWPRSHCLFCELSFISNSILLLMVRHCYLIIFF